jgi:predicted metal-dependent enzyme (double-stranded beta helix superfamily)
MKYTRILIVIAAIFALVIANHALNVVSATRPTVTSLPAPQQYPVMDKIADKIIQKYQGSTCEQLWEEKAQGKNKPKSTQEQEAISILRNDPQMRAAFINKVAPPIANKMFDCGMIP